MIFTLLIALYLSGRVPGSPTARSGCSRPSTTPRWGSLGSRFSGVWNDYIRGELTLMVIMGVTTGIAVADRRTRCVRARSHRGLLEVIPTFGPIIATIPAVLVALVQGSVRFPRDEQRLLGWSSSCTCSCSNWRASSSRRGSWGQSRSRRSSCCWRSPSGSPWPAFLCHPRRTHGGLGSGVVPVRMGQGHRCQRVGRWPSGHRRPRRRK